jgi:hypothetical protein
MIQTNMISFTRHFILLMLLYISAADHNYLWCNLSIYTNSFKYHQWLRCWLGPYNPLQIQRRRSWAACSPFWWRIYNWFLHQLLENHSVLLWHVMVKWIPLVWYLRCFQGSLLWRLQLDNTSNWAMRGLL